MSREDIVAVAVRLFAIFMFFTIVRAIPVAIESYSPETGLQWMIPHLSVLFFWLIVSAFLWFMPLVVARRLLPVMKEPRSEQNIDASIALSLGLTLLGVWFLANALIDGIYWMAVLARVKQTYDTSFEWNHVQIASVFTTAAEIVLAFWLLMGTAGIKRALYRFRLGGFTPPK